MNKFEVFNNEVLGSVRTMYEVSTGEIWFLGNDVAKALGYAKERNAITTHVDSEDQKRLRYVDSPESGRSILWENSDFKDKIFISEAGVYALIFGSKLLAAKDFKHWVTKDVLPAIRKNGGYIMGQENVIESERDSLIAQVKKLSGKVDSITAYSNLWEGMYDRLMKDYEQAVKKMPEKVEEEKQEYFISPDGLLVNKALLK